MSPQTKALFTCYALRTLGYRPWTIVQVDDDGSTRFCEAISYAFPNEDGTFGIMARTKAGDPTTMREFRIPEAAVACAKAM